ncbi:hypothetical protein ACQ4PT_061571 [Festuca glaucescens]
MASEKLAALALLLALLGCVARTCQASYGFPYPLSVSRQSTPPAAPKLNYAHYYKTCKGAEKIMRDVVQEEIKRNRGIGAGLIRLFFHDCFVQGCDASVLLDKTPANEQTEKSGLPNAGSLRGFEVIDKIKTKLEAKCKGVVSARTLSPMLGVMPPTSSATRRSKGLSLDEMVTLSGAHTVGISHCGSFADRLPRNASDPTAMNSKFANLVTRKCKSASSTVDQGQHILQECAQP